jgi:hypothetical protein
VKDGAERNAQRLIHLRATAAFMEAGDRAKKSRRGTTLGREGTGMHDTLSKIRSAKGRKKYIQFMQTEESGILVRPTDMKFLFSEDDTFNKFWTVLILTLVVFTSILIPIQFGFPDGVEDNPGLDYTIDILFILDLIICFRTAYINESGDEVFDTKMIAKKYLKNWFTIDVVACFPAEVFVLISGSKDTRSKILLRLLKMPRLLRIGRLFKYLDQMKYAAVWRVGKLVVMLLFVSHWISCLFYMVCRLELEANYQVYEPFMDVQTASFGEQYMNALTSGFNVLIGDSIDPMTVVEQAFVFAASVLGAIMMAVIIGNISLVLQNQNALSAIHRNKMDMINDSMRAMDISERLQKKTVAYYELLWTRQRALSTKESFIDELSPCLRKEINLDLNTEVIYRCELFKNLLDRDSNNLGEIMTEDTSDHVLVAIINALQREVSLVLLSSSGSWCLLTPLSFSFLPLHFLPAIDKVYLPGDTIIQQGEIGNGECYEMIVLTTVKCLYYQTYRY